MNINSNNYNTFNTLPMPDRSIKDISVSNEEQHLKSLGVGMGQEPLLSPSGTGMGEEPRVQVDIFV